ncbi:MAG: serine/threonine protein kinase, partial [Pirellulaceae bacterium]
MNEKTIFNVARKIKDTKDRDEYLQRSCGDDAMALGRIQDLLEEHENDSRIIDSPPVDLGDTRSGLSSDQQVGNWIGSYKLLQEIGEGGMGTVYMAEQEEPVHRRVALKIIKPGMDSKQVVARFEGERQALALMDHPNITNVLEAGTTDSGLPFFVMELIKGQPITQYCDEQKLSIEQRLELFRSVCSAVQHAHQKGIIHRDLKPSNILVAEFDNVPVPKI